MATTINSVSPALLSTMNPTSSSSTSSSTNSTAASSSGTESAATLQNNFMTMLITQMKNQDPLNPMDNAQVTSQMAQLSTVTGVSQLNTTLTSLMANFQSSQTMQAANLIGKSVVVPGNAVTLSSGAGQFGVNLSSAATNVKATITNAAGAVVDTMNLGSMPSGVSAIPWNGTTTTGTTAPDGQYTFTLTANNGATPVTATGLSVGMVSSVSAGASGAQLNIPTIGTTSFSSVLQIL
ncbi:flagellar hook assembly protein FlgD [Solimicrobium silvestre]|uniref:Basal-body rod modification protein FlgD n=1 Tax=Solimicrobium silvestre TaxID=2099400 RepID=A0A2S9GVV0_9BURK|nr:flagellar hook assembly protein FlgD [Solimicrobium silvestre]PRC91828.1 Flagellar hook capping protein [Solimicrobium silvestre]